MRPYKDDPIPYEELRERCARYEADLERAVKLVLDAGLTTGHAETCEKLIEEVVSQVVEIRARSVGLEDALRQQCERARHWKLLLREERQTSEQLAAAIKRVSEQHQAWMAIPELFPHYSTLIPLLEELHTLYEVAGVEWEEEEERD